MAEEKTSSETSSASTEPGIPEVTSVPTEPPTPEIPAALAETSASPDEPTVPNEQAIKEIPTTPTNPTALQPEPPLTLKPPSTKRRSRFGPIVLSLLFLLIGIIVGAGAVLLFFFALPSTNTPITAPPSQPGNVSVQADATLIGPIAEKSLQEAGIPGTITNLQVQFDQGDQMTITGSYQYLVLGFPVTQNVSIVLQPYAGSCSLQMHILSANYGSIPITSFASIFENKMNSKLQQVMPSTVMNGSYAVCVSGVRTQTGNIILDITLTPTSS
jgi:hypothetical protein